MPPSESLLLIADISSRRVTALVGVMNAKHGDRALAHRAIECNWEDLSVVGRREALAEAVRSASEQAGIEQAYSIFLSRSDPSLASTVEVGWYDPGQAVEITARECEWALHQAREAITNADREVVDALPIRWVLRSHEGDQEIEDPVGSRGHRLTCQALVVTAKRGHRAVLADLARSLDLDLDGVITQPVALYRGLAARLPRRGSTLVIDCGARQTTFLVRRRDQLVHLAAWPYGGDDLTRRIVSALNLPFDQAERLKAEADISAGAVEAAQQGQQVLWAELQADHALRSQAARVLREATLAFFSDRARDLREQGLLAQAGQIHLVGRGSALPGLPQAMRELFDLQVVLGSGDRNRAAGEEMEGLLLTGLLRVASHMRKAQLADQGSPLRHTMSGLWNWLMQPLE